MIPKYLKIQNFASHEDSYVDFDKFVSALIVGMNNNNLDDSNGAGKSSIIESIDWCLFEKSKHPTVEDVIRFQTEEARVEFCFVKNEHSYIAIRKRSRSGAKSFQLKQDGHDISGSTDTDTKEKLEGILGFDHELFANSVFLEQNEITHFASTSPRERKEIIKSILNITKWDDYECVAKDKNKEAISQYEVYCKKHNKSDIVKNIKDASKEIIRIRADKKQLEKDFEKCENKIDGINFVDVKDKERQIKNIRKEIKDANDRKNEKQKQIPDLLKKKDETENIIVRIAELSIPDLSILQQYKDKLNKEEEEHSIIEKEIYFLENSELRTVEKGTCFVCGSEISEEKANTINKDVEERRKNNNKKIKELKLKDKEIKHAINNTKNNINILQKKVNDYNQAQEKVAGKKELLENINGSLLTLKSDVDRLDEVINFLQAKLVDLDVDLLDEDILKAKEAYDNLKEAIEKANINIGIYSEKRSRFLEEYNNYLKDLVVIDKLKKDSVLYDQLRKVFGKKGIQSVILLKTIKELEAKTNDVLKLICSENKQMTISIDTQTQKTDGAIKETFDINATIGARTSNFQSLSGGEKVRVSFAIRIALSQILASKRGGNVGLILLDEVDSSLDNIGVTSFLRVVRELEKKFKLLVITHKDDIKDMFTNKILVRNDFGVSKVYQH